MSKATGDYHTKLEELLADPLVRMAMRADRVTEQQLVKSVGAALSELGEGSSAGPADTLEERAARDYRPSVGIILLNRHNQAFVGRRCHTNVEAWHMPQGGIGKGEDPRTAAFRKLKEQIGTDEAEVLAENKSWLFYDLPVGLTGRVRRRGCRGQRQKWFVMRFKGSDADINVKAKEPEFCDWKWVSIGELPKIIGSLKRLVYLSVFDEFLDAIGPYEDQIIGNEADPRCTK
jgi:putative (di)nucleoside polyphosphate hydrolase